MPTDTQPKTDSNVPTQWPPIAHIKRGSEVDEGDEALCGERLMGIPLDAASKVCEECVRVFREEVGDADQ